MMCTRVLNCSVTNVAPTQKEKHTYHRRGDPIFKKERKFGREADGGQKPETVLARASSNLLLP
jgi:hypothetical protein